MTRPLSDVEKAAVLAAAARRSCKVDRAGRVVHGTLVGYDPKAKRARVETSRGARFSVALDRVTVIEIPLEGGGA